MKKWFVTLILVLFAVPTVGLADGGSDFKARCAVCHGLGGNPLTKTARMLKVDPRKLALRSSQLNRDEMIVIIEKGRNEMPAYEKVLTKERITDIADYITAFKNKK